MLAGTLQFHLASIPAQRGCPLSRTDCRFGDLQQCPAFPLKYCLDRYVVLTASAHIPSFSTPPSGGRGPGLATAYEGVPVKAAGFAGAPKGSKSLYGERRCGFSRAGDECLFASPQLVSLGEDRP